MTQEGSDPMTQDTENHTADTATSLAEGSSDSADQQSSHRAMTVPSPLPGPIVPPPGPAGPSPIPDVPVPEVPEPEPAAPPTPPAPEPLAPPSTPEPAAPEPSAPEPSAPRPLAPPPLAPHPLAPESLAPEPLPSEPLTPEPEPVTPEPEPVTPEPLTPVTPEPVTAPPTGGRNERSGDRSGRAGDRSGRPGSRSERLGRPGAARPGGGHPGGRPGGSGRGSAGSRSVVPPVVEPIVEPVDPHQWGRIDDDGVVYVSTPAGERPVGNWQAGDAEAGLAHYGRRFDDFSTEIALLEARLAAGTGDPKTAKQQAISLREQVPTLSAVGDLDSAAARLEVVIGAADQAIAGASQARVQARTKAIAGKEALCVEAEELAESTQWKTSGDRLKAIVEEWRQIHGIDRKTDDALWKRFAKARDTFSRHRGSHFAELDKQRAAAKDVKEDLIKRAEALSESTEWGETAGNYRDLMTEWKAAGRAPRDVEDALWDRFRAAQEKFFAHRNQVFSERDAEFEGNAAKKEQLLAEAERIDPSGDLERARSALRSIQERWEDAGKVPRERIREFDSRLRAIEDKVRKAEDSQWRRTDPETQARVEQFRSRVDQFRGQAEKALAAGDARKAQEAQAQAEQWEQWLAAAENAVDD